MEAIAASRVAAPTLASSLLGANQLADLVEAAFQEQLPACQTKDKSRIGAGVNSVDAALGGGLSRGRVVCVSGEAGGSGNDLALSFLISSLLSHPSSVVAIIDTIGNLDVLRIYQLIFYRLQSNAQARQAYPLDEESQDVNFEEVAAKILDRVKIMRVFDLVGVMEAISEIREELEGGRSKPVPTVMAKEDLVCIAEDKKRSPGTPLLEKPKKIPKSTIADSEDEDDDDEEMLFDEPVSEPSQTEAAARAAQATGPSTQPPHDEPEPGPVPKPSGEDSEDPTPESKISVIMIDNIAHVLSQPLKKDYFQTNTLASALLCSLNHLTHTHDLYTVLLNPASLPRPQSPTRKAPDNQPQPSRPPQYPIPSPSIFSSNKLIPALGNLLPPYLDMHLMVSKVPKGKQDARVLAQYEGTVKTLRGVQMANVVEVLADRWEGRSGDWGVFGVDGEKGVI